MLHARGAQGGGGRLPCSTTVLVTLADPSAVEGKSRCRRRCIVTAEDDPSQAQRRGLVLFATKKLPSGTLCYKVIARV